MPQQKTIPKLNLIIFLCIIIGFAIFCAYVAYNTEPPEYDATTERILREEKQRQADQQRAIDEAVIRAKVRNGEIE